jgi:hypothetical protein
MCFFKTKYDINIIPCGVVKQPPTKAKHLKTFSPRKDCVFLTTVLIHIYILGMGLIQLLILLLLTHLIWICRGLWYSLISYLYYCFAKLPNWIGGISEHFRLKFFPAHLFVPGPVSFVKFIP